MSRGADPVHAPRLRATAVHGTTHSRMPFRTRQARDWLLILGRRHLEAVLAEYVEQYNGHRPHRSLELRPPRGSTVIPALTGEEVVRRTRVHGLINEYSQRAT